MNGYLRVVMGGRKLFMMECWDELMVWENEWNEWMDDGCILCAGLWNNLLSVHHLIVSSKQPL